MPLAAIKIKSGIAFSIWRLEENGKCEMLEFWENMDNGYRAKIDRSFRWTVENGLLRNNEKFKYIGDGLYEFRTIDGVRVFCFLDEGKMLICTGGYIKKKDKLDPAEISRAKILKSKYESEKSAETLTFEEQLI
ncbi:MAG: type II toxin-antitoxin system RelE/ParE family toxin [Limisphaerales bacterium]